MPKITLSLFDPIVVEIVGVGEFKIETLSSKLLGDLQKAVSAYGSDPEKIKSDEIAGVLMKMLPGITKEQAMDVDLRHVITIAEFLAEQINPAKEEVAEKN
jgi:hypothetical protein